MLVHENSIKELGKINSKTINVINKHNTIGKGKKERAVNGGLDKYFTKPFIADYFSNIILEKYGQSQNYIEPTAGNGSFMNILPNITGYDIHPDNNNIKYADVFNLKFNTNDIIIGNPPFGMNASIAYGIFNHITKQKVKAICFILPKTFKKKSIQNRLNLNYHLVFEQDIIDNAFIVNEESYNVPCVFQIWEYQDKKRIISPNQSCEWLSFVNKEEADIAVRRAGGKAGKVLDGIEYSKSSTYFIKLNNPLTLTALRLMDLTTVNFTAGVKSISKQELIYEVNKIMEILTKEN